MHADHVSRRGFLSTSAVTAGAALASRGAALGQDEEEKPVEVAENDKISISMIGVTRCTDAPPPPPEVAAKPKCLDRGKRASRFCGRMADPRMDNRWLDGSTFWWIRKPFDLLTAKPAST